MQSVTEQETIREFISCLAVNHLDATSPNTRLDFLLSNVAGTPDGSIIARELELLSGVSYC